MIEPSPEELERRLEQARRLSREVNDPISNVRIDQLTDDLEAQQQQKSDGRE